MLIGSTISLNTMMLGSTSFTPATLFSRGEQGVWLDPSDVANLNWLYNLLTWTDDFSNAVWVKTDVTATSSVLTATAATSSKNVRQNNTVTGPLTFSAELKAGTLGFVQFFHGSSSNFYANFDLTNGVVGSVGPTVTATITPTGDGWYRCTFTVAPSTASSLRIALVSSASAVFSESWTSAGTETVNVRNAQLEVGSVASPYQAITTVDAGVVERFPLNTMFQDRNGTTPVTTPGQLVGLRLDKSRQLALGPELVVNGDFSNGLTGWSVSGTVSVVDGAASVAGNGTVSGRITSTLSSLVVGRTYRTTFTQLGITGGGIGKAYISTSVSIGGAILTRDTVNGSNSFVFVATATTHYLLLDTSSTSASIVMTLDNISVRELAGNHAMAVSDATRGIYGIEPYGGRRNLLLATDSPTASIGTSVATNVAAAPNGTNNAARVSKTDATTPRYTSQSWTAGTVPAANTVYTASRYVKYDGHNTTVSLEYNSDLTFGLAWIATFNVTPSGVTANAPSLCTSSVQDVGNGWYRISATFTSGATTAAATLVMLSQITGASGVSVLMFGAQLEVVATTTAIASPYQRVTTQYDVTETGVPTVHYVEYSSDAYVTPTIDPSLNPPLGPELVTTPSITGLPAGGGTRTYSTGASLEAGKFYWIEADVTNYSGTSVVGFSTSSGVLASIIGRSSNGNLRELRQATGSGVLSMFTLDTNTANFSNISVRELVTDEVQVFAGVRKLSDAANGLIVESSVAAGANAGAFALLGSVGGATYTFRSSGSIFTSLATTPASYAAPISNVLTGIGDISSDVDILRVNGVQAASSTDDQGTGSYGAYPIYIGARAGTSTFFDGRDYGIIVRFGPNLSNTMISNTEDWLGEKTGVLYVLLNGVWQDQYTWVDNLNWNDGV